MKNILVSRLFWIVLIGGFILLSGNLCAIAVQSTAAVAPMVPSSFLYTVISTLATIVAGFAIYFFKSLISSINKNMDQNTMEHKEIAEKVNKIEKDRIEKDAMIDIRLTKIESKLDIE